MYIGDPFSWKPAAFEGSNGIMSVICETCGAEISEFSAPERAITAWNRRADNG